MACYAIKWMGEPVVVTRKKNYLLAYLLQKDGAKPFQQTETKYLSLEKIPRYLFDAYIDTELYEDSSGYIVSNTDIMALHEREEEECAMIRKTLGYLEDILEEEKLGKKTKKALKKTMGVLRDREKRIKSGKMRLTMLGDILAIPLHSYIAEWEMMREYRGVIA